MKSRLTSGLMSGLSLFAGLAFAQNTYKVDITPFPKAEKGQKQVVIEVPNSENDINKKIEIFVGKTMETDACNRHFLSGQFVSSELKGWGYNYLTFKTKGDIAATNMGCMNAKNITQFIKSQGFLTDYNGRMPIVIYVPEEFDVKFKIYTAENDLYNGQEVMTKKK